jgi:hypothetical protein
MMPGHGECQRQAVFLPSLERPSSAGSGVLHGSPLAHELRLEAALELTQIVEQPQKIPPVARVERFTELGRT